MSRLLSEPPCSLPLTLTAPCSATGYVQGRACGEGHPRGHTRVTNGEECFSPEPTLKAHQLFMAIKRPNFLPREGPTAQSTASQTRRGSRVQPQRAASSPLLEDTTGWRQPPGRGEQVSRLAASSRGHARGPRPRPAGRCVHPLNNLHPPGNGPQRCQSH